MKKKSSDNLLWLDVLESFLCFWLLAACSREAPRPAYFCYAQPFNLQDARLAVSSGGLRTAFREE